MNQIISPKNINWDKMPFSHKWAGNILKERVDGPRGFIKIQAFEHKDEIAKGELGQGKLIYEFSDENQVMHWLKHAFAMLEGGIWFADSGEHMGYEDGSGTELDETDEPTRIWSPGGTYPYLTHVWKVESDTLARVAGDITDNNAPLYPYFPTKIRFGKEGPEDISTVIDPYHIGLNDPDANWPGNTANKLNFIMINRTTHITVTTTGYSTTTPSGYYLDYGQPFKNITVYQITMPVSAVDYCYDGLDLTEAGLYCDAALLNTNGGSYDMPSGMLLAKRYFYPIRKSPTVSIQFQWSICK
jgi:hypothetical protein